MLKRFRNREQTAPEELTTRTTELARVAFGTEKLEGIVLPRKPQIHNDLFISKGGAILVRPDQEAVHLAVTASNKLHYFEVSSTPSFQESDYSFIADPEFSDLIMKPLFDRIRSDFPGHKMLTFRGGMASINGTQVYEYGHSDAIPDVTEIVSKGGDREGVFNAATADMAQDISDIAIMLHRVTQFASSTHLRRLDIGYDAPEVAETLFPVVSVYDSAYLRTADGGVWAVQPQEGYAASDILLATYLLDCPG